MNPTQVVALHPRLYHMAEPEAWPSIKVNGLLSTAALVDRLGLDARQRDSILRSSRANTLVFNDPLLGTVSIRDNKPMNIKMLRQAVVGVSAEDFLEMINGRVFFWPTRDRLERFLQVYGDSDQVVLEIDTMSLLTAHGPWTDLSPLNSGAVRMVSHRRGRATFTPMLDIDFDLWRGSRMPSKAIAEVCVRGEVADLADHLVSATLVRASGPVEPLELG